MISRIDKLTSGQWTSRTSPLVIGRRLRERSHDTVRRCLLNALRLARWSVRHSLTESFSHRADAKHS